MGHLNVEFKARCRAPDAVLRTLHELGAQRVGTDEQTDVYYRADAGRLKLRRGSIENHLIHYERPDSAEPGESAVRLVPVGTGRDLDELLDAALRRDVVVVKRRQIFWLENVKVHVDEVDGLGSFLEVEAVDYDGTIGDQRLREQCATYRELFGVCDDDLEPRSYSDLLRQE